MERVFASQIIPEEGGSIALIFLELQGDLHSGKEVVLVGNMGQLIPLGNLELSRLGLCMLEGVL